MSTTKRTVLITGCSAGGIGANLAHQYSQRPNYHIFATARNTSKIPSSLSSSPNVTTLSLDITSPSSISSAVQTVFSQTNGKLDILINNSGAALTAPVLDTDLDVARGMFEVNVFGTLAVTQAFTPLLLASTKDPVVVNNTSINGSVNLPFSGVYGASKAAATIISETLRLEVQPLGIRVVTLVTGIVATNLHANESKHELPEGSSYKILEEWLEARKAGSNRPPSMKAEEYAKKVVEKIERGSRGKIFVGTLGDVIQYLQWWMPTWVWDQIMIMSGPKNWQSDLAKAANGGPQKSS